MSYSPRVLVRGPHRADNLPAEISYAKRIFQGLPLNEELGHPDNPKTWYAYGNDPNEGYVSRRFVSSSAQVADE